MATTSTARAKNRRENIRLGPISDLEAHLPEDWWSSLFDELYLLTDGDVVENADNTRADVDAVIAATGIRPGDTVTDLCCGQGRHVLELATRGFRSITGIDRSRYLIQTARRRAAKAGTDKTVSFREGDARNPRIKDESQDAILIMGNAFGYFSNPDDDKRVLRSCARDLKKDGVLLLDITDGDWIRSNFEPRSWEWIDQHHFVCRERALSQDGDRLISREVINNDERGVIADQFYAERLYSSQRIIALLQESGYRDVKQHTGIETRSERGQDLGMMAHRMLITAIAPERASKRRTERTLIDVAVVLGDPRLPDPVKRNGKFNEEDFTTVNRLKDALGEVDGYQFRYLDNHETLETDLKSCAGEMIFNLCDEGLGNDAFKELHVPALLEINGLAYTGSAPGCLAMCYDKALVRALAQSIEIPVPLETFIRPGDQLATLPAVFPAILKPNFGDSSIGITVNAVVNDKHALMDYLQSLRESFADQPLLVQEFLTGAEYSVTLIGNPKHGLRALPALEVDYASLDPSLPHILGYESKWLPDSAYWTQIRYKQAALDEHREHKMVGHAIRLFERLGCRDYARFDFRTNAEGEIKLLEANPNPGWCWDGKMNLMASFEGTSYPMMLKRILDTARARLGLRR